MVFMIKYYLSNRASGNLGITVAPVLKMAANRLFLSVATILKHFKSKFGKYFFIFKSYISKIATFLCFNLWSTSQIGGPRFNGKINLFTTGHMLVDY